MYDVKRTMQEEVWRSFLEAERAALEKRRNGELTRALGEPVPGESSEELRWLVIEDQYLAEEGLVELRSGEDVWHKHIDDLAREDRSTRIEAENARVAWLMERLRKSMAPESDGRGEA